MDRGGKWTEVVMSHLPFNILILFFSENVLSVYISKCVQI